MTTRDRNSLGPDASRPFTVKQLLEQPLTDVIAQTLAMKNALAETTEDRRQSVVSSGSHPRKLARMRAWHLIADRFAMCMRIK